MSGYAARFATRGDGDFRVDGDEARLAEARHRFGMGHPWTWLRQVHGADVVVVDRPGAGAGSAADAAVTAAPGAVLAVHTADCVPLLLVDDHAGVAGAVHVGWRGLVAGVVERAVDAMAGLGADPGRVLAELGPCIRVGCYEFGAEPLAEVAGRYGDAVAGTTTNGTPGLDLPAGVDAALAVAGVGPALDRHGCTACDPRRYFSHRARGERGRQASFVLLWP